MDEKIEGLYSLCSHNLAAIEIYKIVLNKIESNEISKKLETFLKDHANHLEDLRYCFAKLEQDQQ